MPCMLESAESLSNLVCVVKTVHNFPGFCDHFDTCYMSLCVTFSSSMKAAGLNGHCGALA